MRSSQCKKHSTASNNHLLPGALLITKFEWVAFITSKIDRCGSATVVV
jgi:hypothetical protein